MKVKFKLADGLAVHEMSDKPGHESTLEEAIELLKNPNVIQITVTRMTAAQYLKKAAKEYKNGGLQK